MKSSLTKWFGMSVILLGESFVQAHQAAIDQPRQINIDQAKSLVLSGDPRGQAYLYFKASFENATPEQKAELKTQNANWILALIDAPVQANENWEGSSPRNEACDLAGLFKINAAIPSLIKLLSPLPGQIDVHHGKGFEPTVDGFTLSGPSIDALIQIGSSAKPALQSELQVVNIHISQLMDAKKDQLFYDELRKKSYIIYILKSISK